MFGMNNGNCGSLGQGLPKRRGRICRACAMSGMVVNAKFDDDMVEHVRYIVLVEFSIVLCFCVLSKKTAKSGQQHGELRLRSLLSLSCDCIEN